MFPRHALDFAHPIEFAFVHAIREEPVPRYRLELRTEDCLREAVSIQSVDLRALRIEMAKCIGELSRSNALKTLRM